MKLYYHKTDGGAEYLMDTFITNPDGSKEGVIEGASYVVRIDGDITKDAELTGLAVSNWLPLLTACKRAMNEISCESVFAQLLAAIHEAEGC